jgi:hypothetical protein
VEKWNPLTRSEIAKFGKTEGILGVKIQSYGYGHVGVVDFRVTFK